MVEIFTKQYYYIDIGTKLRYEIGGLMYGNE